MAEAGLMKGRRCAVHTHHRKEFITRYPDSIPVVNEIYVKDGPFFTCPGGTAAIDLAVDILCARCGKSRGMKGPDSPGGWTSTGAPTTSHGCPIGTSRTAETGGSNERCTSCVATSEDP